MRRNSIHRLLALTCCILFCGGSAQGHPGHDSGSSIWPAWQGVDGRGDSRLRMIDKEPASLELTMPLTGLLVADPGGMPEIAKPFQKFERVKTRWDASYLYIESNGLPDHSMMKGITAWQQHVPLPQPYTGANAWRIPLNPVAAKLPTMIHDHFLRGAVALAVNGIPIFNPQNNRGEISQEIGELDEWGGHCGRGDDYHYHITPLHLQEVVGKGMPVAYALDGYPIYGLTEPDGSPVGTLDECHGHETAIGYHYHGAVKSPYVMAGFHGEIIERGGQVDPQPRANPIRSALQPLRGATVLGLKSIGKDQNELTYEIGGKRGYVRYALKENGSYAFEFETPNGQKQEQTFQRRDDKSPPAAVEPKKESPFALRSSALGGDNILPVDFSGDGSGATLPLEWSNPPAGTKSYAIIMHHIPGPGEVKWYWVLYNIPAEIQGIPKNVKGVGTLGNNSVNRRVGYAPPHSKGPGAKTYILTIYALSAAPQLAVGPEKVDRETLLASIKDRTLGSAELKVIYDRTAVIEAGGAAPRRSAPVEGPREGAIRLIPREAEEKLNLTTEQQKSLAALRSETEAKLNQILNPAQIKILQDSRPPRRD